MAPSLRSVIGLLALGPLVSGQGCPFAGAEKRDVLPGRGAEEPSLTTLADSFGKCPTLSDAAGGGTRSKDWWPCQLSLDVLRQFSPEQNPLGGSFDYAAAFAKLDYAALKRNIRDVLKTSQPWWPADYGNYGPFFIRLTWHSAGTYRAVDGRGGGGMGQQRFAPLNSWPDNGNLDKGRRLLWPIKQKYGRSISWADLLLLAGNVALEDMGFPVLGFGAGRPDTWQSDESVFWGAETTFVPKGNDIRYNGSTDFVGRATHLEEPLAALGAPPEGGSLEQQDFGWANTVGKGNAEDTVTSGLDVIWSTKPTKWTNDYLKSLFENEWTLTKSPAGAPQFVALNGTVDYPEPFGNKFRKPSMLVSDLALREDPIYSPIAKSWSQSLPALEKAFAAAWFKLLHRDMGPISRYLGPEVPKQRFTWQDPLPTVSYSPITDDDVSKLKKKILGAPDCSISALVSVAWGSASTFRGGDKRGGANGARISLQPQASWPVNNPKQLQKVLASLNAIKTEFNAKNGPKQVSLADLIVLGGNAAVEMAASAAGHRNLNIKFTVGRVDATQADTDIASFENLNPQGDGFRNFRNNSGWSVARTEALLVDKAQQLTLTAPEMTALVGGMRALNTNWDGSDKGVLTSKPGTLTNDFFVNLLDMATVWMPDPSAGGELYIGKDRTTGGKKWTATRADLVFGSHAELRAIAEVYAEKDGDDQLVVDFVAAWAKVMDLDRFDVKK